MTSVRSSRFTSQPLSRSSAASQSSSSGCVGHSPCAPRSSTVRERPWPNASFKSRFARTRAVSGFSRRGEPAREVEARRGRVRRCRGAAGSAGRRGATTSPESSCQLPRGRTRTGAGSAAVVTYALGTVAANAALASSASRRRRRASASSGAVRQKRSATAFCWAALRSASATASASSTLPSGSGPGSVRTGNASAVAPRRKRPIVLRAPAFWCSTSVRAVSPPPASGSASSTTRRWLSPSEAARPQPAPSVRPSIAASAASPLTVERRRARVPQREGAPGRVTHLHLGDDEVAVRPAAGSTLGQLLERRRLETQGGDAGELGLVPDGVGVLLRLRPVRGRGDDREVVPLDEDARAVRRRRLDRLERGEGGEPARAKGLLPRRARRVLRELAQLRAPRLDRRVERVEAGPLRGIGQRVRLTAADRLLLHVGEERLERVEVARRVRVELVVVALCAAHGRAHPHRRRVANAVGEVDRAVLLRLRTALLGRLQEPVVAGGDPLVGARLGKEVAAELLGGEAVERQVAVEGGDHPVPVAPHRPRVVAVIADAVGVAHEVEPEDRHPLAVSRRGEEPVHQALVRVGPGVGLERAHFLGGRRKAGEVEARAAQQLGARGLGRGGEALRLEPRANEGIDRVPRPGGVLDLRHGRARERHVRPVGLPGSALRDPAPQERDLRVREPRLAALRERHAPRLVGVGDAGDERASLRRTGDDRHGPRAHRGLGRRLDVEAQPGLAAVAVGAVAGEAALGEDRPHFAVEAHGRGAALAARRGRRRLRRVGDHHPRRPWRAGLDPPPYRLDLGRGQWVRLVRHAVDGVSLDEVREDGAQDGRAGQEHGTVLAAGEHPLARVEAQLALLLGRAVAADAGGREDRLDVAYEVGRFGAAAAGAAAREERARAAPLSATAAVIDDDRKSSRRVLMSPPGPRALRVARAKLPELWCG